jgi:3,4-dihydroxy-2-butanone 4-phosphate synthase
MTEHQLDQLNLGMMVPDWENTSGFGTAFTVSIEARRGVTTGISAADRATTILTAIAADAKPTDIARPGHVFPLRARPGGVLRRAGQTEGSVDLARLAELTPAGVICEIMNDDGTMARMPDLIEFSRATRHQDRQHRGHDPVPAAQGEAGAARRDSRPCRRARAASSAASSTRTTSTTSITWRS